MAHTSGNFSLGVLDQSPIAEGSAGADALRNTLELARRADELGYGRYWVAEHHGTPALACASPEVMIGLIADRTSGIRAGSGGVMLPHYSPLKVAETFSMLAALFPGRIDLGIGRAAGTDQATAFALQRDRRQRSPDDFPEQLDELLGYFGHGAPRSAGPRLPRYTQLPGAPHAPEPWLLGSSPQSAAWAAERGLPYCFADFINPAGAEIAAYYREHFVPSTALPGPRVAVAGWAVCAETDEEAERLASSFRMLMTLYYRGQLIPVPPIEKALRFLEEEGGAAQVNEWRRLIVGSPPVVRAGVEDLARAYGADEVLLVNILYDHAARRHSYELVAEAFGLSRAGTAERSPVHVA
jgi:luciferase family oxidoreductase group 1